MENFFEKNMMKRLVSIRADQLSYYLSQYKFRRFFTAKLLSSGSVGWFDILDDIGKKDLSEGWVKQEYILRFLSEISSIVKTEYFYNDLTSFFRNFWDNFAGCFGVNYGSENKRYTHSKKILDAVLGITSKNERKQIILNIFDLLRDATYLASGANRYAPLTLFVINLFCRNSIYSTKYLPHSSKVLKLLRNHLFYNKGACHGNIKYTDTVYVPELPQIILDVPYYAQNNTVIQWLDIGCAPKVHGSPTLSLLNNVFKQCDLFRNKNIFFEFTGTDVYFPYYSYKISKKEIDIHKMFSVFRHGIEKLEYGGITYLNANYDVNNVNSIKFMGNTEKKYHFISACKVMHHFLKNQPVELMQLAKRIKVDNKYLPILWDNDDARVCISKSQRFVIENLLRLLKIGGFLLVDLSNPHFRSMNYNFFFVIQRLSDTKVKLYDFVIPYDPDDKKVYPHEEYILCNKDYVFNKICSIKKNEIDKREFTEDFKELKCLIRQLDIIVYYSQSKENIPNQKLHFASEAFASGTKLVDACKIYVEGIFSKNCSIHTTQQNKKNLSLIAQILKQVETIENKYRSPQVNSVLNVMMIGCGGAARDSYIPGIISVNDANLVSIIIPGDKQSKRDAITQITLLGQTFFPNNHRKFIGSCIKRITQLSKNGKALDYDKDWADIEFILDREFRIKKITAIIIGSPEGFHHKYIEWALKRRLHIACDKPLTSRIGITTSPLGRNNQKNKVALATELINDYHKYIKILNKINLTSPKELQFEILTKKRYSKVVASIKNELRKSPAKIIQIFTADGWWLTPAQLARTDIFTMYGMHGYKSDGGKLVHTAAHFLDLAIIFAMEGRKALKYDIFSADVAVCFIRGYDSVVRSNNKRWLDVEASHADIVDKEEIHIQLNKYFNTIKKLPEINLSLQIKLTFSKNDVVYVQLMGLHENFAKMANKYADYKQRFQSRTKVDHIFVMQKNGGTIEYRRLNKVMTGDLDKKTTNNKQHELYIGNKRIQIPFEENIDTKPIIRFLENIKLTQFESKKSHVLSYSALIRHEYDVKILAAIYKVVAEHYIESVRNKTLFQSDRQLYFKYLFRDDNSLVYFRSDFIDSDIPYFRITKTQYLDKMFFDEVEKIKNITKYGIISIQCVVFGGIFRKGTKQSTGFSLLDDLIALVQFSYENVPDEKLIDWQISLQSETRINTLTAQIIFYGQKNSCKYIACQLQLFAIDIERENNKFKNYSRPFIHSLSIAHGPFALILAASSASKNKTNMNVFYSNELFSRIL